MAVEAVLDFATRFVNAGHVKLWAGAFVVGFVLELLITAERGQPWRLRLLNIGHAFIYALIVFVAAPFIFGGVNQLARDLGGARIELPFFKTDNLGIQVLGTFVYFAIVDFFYYWYHRAQHTIPLLWDQHIVHHSETALNVTTAVRHHWSEFAFQSIVVVLPILLLVDLKPTNHVVISAVFASWSFFIHMNIRVHLGPFAWLLAGPQVHRLHHSIEPQHRNRNFAAYFPLWDVIFGTYWHPRPSEYPATGLNAEKHESLLSLSLTPFARWLRRIGGLFARADRKVELAGPKS